jgi:hypothetical protein
MEESGHLHASAALSPRRYCLVPVERRLGSPENLPGRFGDERKSLVCNLCVKNQVFVREYNFRRADRLWTVLHCSLSHLHPFGVGVCSVYFSVVMLVVADLLPVAHCGQRIA